MTERIKCFDRSRHVLQLLKIHGPLSARTLHRLIEPPMKLKKLRNTLTRMCKSGLLVKRLENHFSHTGVFYQASQDPMDRANAAILLNCKKDDLLQPDFRYRELLHTQNCAVWVHTLKRLYPDAIIIRDFEFTNFEVAKQFMSANEDDPDLRPDLLMVLRSTDGQSDIAIALEIEKTRKTNERLLIKLNKYANETFVDGVIYVCSKRRILEVIRDLFVNVIAPSNMRIKHYVKHFFMFSDDIDIHNFRIENVYNCDLETTSITKWISFLRGTSFNFRRDGKIKTWGQDIPHV